MRGGLGPKIRSSCMFGWSPTGIARGPSMKYPPTPLGAEALRRASTKASVGHPPISEIRRSMTQSLLTEILSGVTHSSTAKAVRLLRRRMKIYEWCKFQVLIPFQCQIA